MGLDPPFPDGLRGTGVGPLNPKSLSRGLRGAGVGPLGRADLMTPCAPPCPFSPHTHRVKVPCHTPSLCTDKHYVHPTVRGVGAATCWVPHRPLRRTRAGHVGGAQGRGPRAGYPSAPLSCRPCICPCLLLSLRAGCLSVPLSWSERGADHTVVYQGWVGYHPTLGVDHTLESCTALLGPLLRELNFLSCTLL